MKINMWKTFAVAALVLGSGSIANASTDCPAPAYRDLLGVCNFHQATGDRTWSGAPNPVDHVDMGPKATKAEKERQEARETQAKYKN